MSSRWAAHSPKLVPRGLQNLIESVCVYLREEMARPLIGHHTDHYIGFLWTIFFFILTLNLIAMVPMEKIISLVTGRPMPSRRPRDGQHLHHGRHGGHGLRDELTSMGFASMEFFGYLAHLAPPAPKWLLPLIYPLELLSIFIRPFTLAIRLFANIIAGHMVLATILGLIFVFQNLGVAVVSVARECRAVVFGVAGGLHSGVYLRLFNHAVRWLRRQLGALV